MLKQQTLFSIQCVEHTLQWYGHLLRMSSHLSAKLVLDLNPAEADWKQSHGKPKHRWSDGILKY